MLLFLLLLLDHISFVSCSFFFRYNFSLPVLFILLLIFHNTFVSFWYLCMVFFISHSVLSASTSVVITFRAFFFSASSVFLCCISCSLFALSSCILTLFFSAVANSTLLPTFSFVYFFISFIALLYQLFPSKTTSILSQTICSFSLYFLQSVSLVILHGTLLLHFPSFWTLLLLKCSK